MERRHEDMRQHPSVGSHALDLESCKPDVHTYTRTPPNHEEDIDNVPLSTTAPRFGGIIHTYVYRSWNPSMRKRQTSTIPLQLFFHLPPSFNVQHLSESSKIELSYGDDKGMVNGALHTTAPATVANTVLNTVPRRSQSESSDVITLTPSRKMAFFENLAALANHKENLRMVRRMAWRDSSEPVAQLDDLKACLKHAAKGSFRSAMLVFNIRACANLVLALYSPQTEDRDERFAIIKDIWRLSAMVGTFAGMYKFLLNALPILFPNIGSRKDEPTNKANEYTLDNPTKSAEVMLPQRAARLSSSTSAKVVFQRKRARWWHAAVAGAIAGGLGIVWEKRSRRADIAQQVFVRGLQGCYNAIATKHNIHVPNGDVLVFSLACGQIMYAFLLRPDTLPRWYRGWIARTAKMSKEFLNMSFDFCHKEIFSVRDLDKICAKPEITSANFTDLQTLRELFFPPLPSSNPIDASVYRPRYAPCSATHHDLTSCLVVPLNRFFFVFRSMFPTYSMIHFIPAILLKRKGFKRDPMKVLVRAGLGSMRSSAFLGIFLVIYQSLFCSKHNLHRFLTKLKRSPSVASNPLAKIPQRIVDLLTSRASFWVLGYCTGLSLFVEDKRRRSELAMYVLPKALESLWVMAREKGLVCRTGKWGETLLATIGMGMVMSIYQNDPQHLSGLVRRILYQLIGPN